MSALPPKPTFVAAGAMSAMGKREGDHGWSSFKCVVKGLDIERLRDVIDRKRSARQFSHRVDVTFDGGGRSKKRSDAAQPAFVGHGGRELRRRASPHGRQDNRHINAKQVAEARFKHCDVFALQQVRADLTDL
jgi:hypothetical protein